MGCMARAPGLRPLQQNAVNCGWCKVNFLAEQGAQQYSNTDQKGFYLLRSRLRCQQLSCFPVADLLETRVQRIRNTCSTDNSQSSLQLLSRSARTTVVTDLSNGIFVTEDPFTDNASPSLFGSQNTRKGLGSAQALTYT